MNNLIKCSLLGSLLFMFVTITQAQNPVERQKASIEKAIDSLFKENLKAAETFNTEKLTQSVDDRYKAGFIINDVYYNTFDSLMTVFKSRLSGVNNQEIDVQKKKITILSENIAILTAYGNSKVNLSSGQSFSTKFAWSFVYEKINNKWKIVHSHQSGSR